MIRVFSVICFAFLAVINQGCAPKYEPGTFEIGEKAFLLNGEPFVVKAAEIHYSRIPHEYWEHRIEMCKAMGMNSICLYIFWNIHEQKPGEFDFTGQNDIAKFCRLAQKHGMWVIVRPGPYVCAEWEMGGLPWWLLKKEDIKLRTNDPLYLERVGLFMNEVGKQLSDLQITRGGNIVMVQVENEYGAYATDKEHIANIRDIVKGAGFTEVPLFQCDWSSNFMNNALDDLLWTVNFGAGANIENQFRRLQKERPNTPLMCSEFWSGWFDHWGRKHETRKTESLVDGLRDMLDRDISFSLYMAHGGTTFGQWGGANAPTYSAMCSSYDYDAPISEAGHTTEKFFAVRELLGNYLPEGKTLAGIPEQIPMIEIPEFRLTEVAPMLDNLPEKIISETVKPMEQFDQGWGNILYRNTLHNGSDSNSILEINDVHDWAQVFLDGRKIGTLDRRKRDKSIMLPPFRDGAVLDIMVEAMGRVNFGQAIHDRKGITNNVILKTGDTDSELKNWEIYSFPVDYQFVKGKKYGKGDKTDVPAYYKGTFKVDKPGDVFLDMQKWGKGMAWVNGYPLGRFWKIGPQQTLFLPGCWLKKGVNEIIILDLDGPEDMAVSGRKTPILDMLRTDEGLLNRRKGEELDITGIIPAYSGSFRTGNGWQDIKFGKAVKGRYFCLEALSSHGEDGFASIAELYVLGQDGLPVSRMNWKVVYADSEEVNAANNAADKVFDLQESTFWHTEYKLDKPGHPHHLVIDLGEEIPVTGFRYLPRAEADASGMIKDYRIYISGTPFKL